MVYTKRDIYILFAARTLRLFAYGFLSVILLLYLSQLGLNEYQIGLLITLTLIGDAVISLWITTHADKYSRKIMLIFGAVLMTYAGIIFVVTDNYFLLIITAIIGVISPTGKEMGPFLSIEQSSLAQITGTKNLTKLFAWYNLAGSFAASLGALFAGWSTELLQKAGFSLLSSYKIILAVYGLTGISLFILFLFLSEQIKVKNIKNTRHFKQILGLHHSKKTVIKLSSLFALDAFAGGFIIQSIIAYWFFIKFNVNPGILGSILFTVNLAAGISTLLAERIAKRFGLVNTMVFTHLPSNVLLILIPLMPNLIFATAMLILRFCISQMDVPVRQAYTIALVSEDERSAASGITNITRSIGASLSPSISGIFLANPLFISLPFFFAGGLKIIYDLCLYFNFRNLDKKNVI